MALEDGREANQPYRVRVRDLWYWVDPRMSADTIEPGDTVVIYPVNGDPTIALLQSPFKPRDLHSIEFSNLEGERFSMPSGDIAALHLAAADEEQT